MTKNTAEKILECSNNSAEYSENWWSKITKTQEAINENLQQALSQTEDDENDRAARLLYLIFESGGKKVDKYIEKIETTLLQEELSWEEKKILRDFLLENSKIGEKIPSFIKFFKNKDLLNSLSFDAVYQLLSFNLTNKQLENLIRIADAWSQRDVEVNGILERINDKKILSNSIVEKIIKLRTIGEEYDLWGMDNLNMDFKIEDSILLKDIILSEQLIEKIWLLMKLNVSFSINNLKTLDKFEIDETMINKLQILEDKVHVYFADLSTIKEMSIDENLLKKINKIDKLYEWKFYVEDLPKIQKLSEMDIQKLEYIKTKLRKNLDYIDFDLICNLEKSEIDKIIWDMKKLWLSNVSCFGILHNISDDVLQYCIKNKVTDYGDIKKIKAVYSISNQEHIKAYLHRKNDYLENNRTLTEEKYKEYFWWKWKFGKHEIKQWNLGLCYLYSWLEILKKMNWFAELVQSNLIEKDGCWLVRLPLNTWKWIKVNKNEIDRIYEYEIENYWFVRKIRKMNINSESEYLWFKILEIAYIKNKLIHKSKDNKIPTDDQNGGMDNPLDINITWEMLQTVEWGDTIDTLQELLSKENIVKWGIWWYNICSWRLEELKKIGAPKCILKNRIEEKKEKSNRMDVLFDLFSTWLLSIEFGSRDLFYPLWNWIKKVVWKKTYFLVSNVDIVDKFWQKIPKEKMGKRSDIVIDERWNTKIKIVTNHAYSVEKCYIDENWEKKVRVVNPWHTDIKFVLSLNQCKDLFDWEFGVVNIDNLFR